MPYTVDGEEFSTRALVTIAAADVDATLTDKDIFYDLSELDATWWAAVKSDGGDIRITDGDGSTRLPLDVVSINSVTEIGETHFKGTLSSSVDNDFYIYCGNASATQPGAGTTYGSQAVWDSGYVVVYHLEDANDSTSNGYNLTASTSAPTSDTGKLGTSSDGGYDFDKASNQRFSKTDETALQISGNWTTAAWFKSDGTLSSNNYIIAKGSGTSANYYTILVGNDMYGGCYSTTDTAFISAISSTPAWDDSAWHYVQVTCTGDTIELWIDGVSKDTATDATVSVTDTSDLTVGGVINNNDFDGWIDEPRLSNAARSDAWLTFDYNNQNDPAAFFTTNASETAPPAGKSFAIIID